MSSSRRRALALLGAGLVVPWAVLLVSGEPPFLVFAWGLATPSPPHATSIVAYLFVHTRGPPADLLAWPASALLYLGAAASALGLPRGEDRRVTAGLLVLAGLADLALVAALGRNAPGTVVLPTGTVLAWAVAWGWYRDGLVAISRMGTGQPR